MRQLNVEAYGRTEVGPTRTANQDAVVLAGAVAVASGSTVAYCGPVPEAGLLMAVVDGMGGYAGGERAAAIAATELARLTPSDVIDWGTTFQSISARINLAGAVWETPQMGATAAVWTLRASRVVVANIGDARTYRRSGAYLGQLSVDDRTDVPGSTAITQALGGPPTTLDAHAWHQDLEPGAPQRYLLCSDGVYGALDNARLRDVCAADQPPARVVEAILEACYAQQAGDNCSALVIDVTVG